MHLDLKIRHALRSSRLVALGLALALAWTLAQTAAATERPQAVRGALGIDTRRVEARFVYKAEGKRLPELLLDFAASQGTPAIVADGVDGVVHGNFDTTPRLFLDAISKTYSVIWYHDGTAIYFYPAKSIQSRIFRLKGYSQAQLQDLMHSLKLGDQRYPLKFDSAQKSLLVYGPPRHIELVASAIESLDIGATEGNERVVRVLSLRFASAGDRTLGEHTIPGVASILRSLFSGGSLPNATPGDIARSPRALAGKMKALQAMGPGKFMPELNLKSPGGEPAGNAQAAARGMQSPIDRNDDAPAFEADEGTNAVIVHGRANRMQEYADLVKKLDVQPELVELEATIIDVSTDSIDSLGVDWAVRGQRSSVSVESPAGAATNALAGAAAPGVFSLTTLVANAGRELMLRVHALEGQGKAKIIAKPKVLGVANRPAYMQATRQAMVRVAGNLEANLFTVEAGTRLQVTPQVIARNDGNQLKLSLYIMDGNFESRLVDGIPVIKRSEIRTEAHVRNNESLLIGGITVDSDSDEVNVVPIVSDLPIIGNLFKWRKAQSSRSERLFLITPRLLPSVPDTPASAVVSRSGRGAAPSIARAFTPLAESTSAPQLIAVPVARATGGRGDAPSWQWVEPSRAAVTSAQVRQR
jgi:type III secretion protein C